MQLNAGTYNLASGLVFGGKSNVTLRGAGADQTFLVFTGSNGCHGYAGNICVDSADTNWPGGPSNSASWTAGYTKGATSITLSSVAGLKVGQPLMLDQTDDGADTGSKFVCQSPSTNPPCSLEGNSNNGARNNRDQEQIVQVVSCGTATVGAACTSNNVTISPGLYADSWNSAKSPGGWWATTPVMGVGIEDMSLDNSGSGSAGGVEIFNCMDCWVSGVRSIKSARSHVEVFASARVTVQNSYFYLTQNAVSQSYGVSPYGSTDLMVTNNIFQYVATPLQVNGCDGCVLSYNYAINNYYEGAIGYVMPAIMIHTAGNELTLIEGNVGSQSYADVFHGTHNQMTYFRNYFSGTQPACYNGTKYQFGVCNSHRYALEFQSYNREFNVVGNVLGTPSVQNAYQNTSTAIYALGSGNTEGSVTVPSDPLVASTLLRWGNWDVVTQGTRWCGTSLNLGFISLCLNLSEVPALLGKYANAVPSSTTLPASFYFTSTPSWWPSGKPWPPIGPDVTGGNSTLGGHVYTLPAQDCYASVMKGPSDGTGNVLTFNASQCYGGGGVTPPPPSLTPPSNLAATVH